MNHTCSWICSTRCENTCSLCLALQTLSSKTCRLVREEKIRFQVTKKSVNILLGTSQNHRSPPLFSSSRRSLPGPIPNATLLDWRQQLTVLPPYRTVGAPRISVQTLDREPRHPNVVGSLDTHCLRTRTSMHGSSERHLSCRGRNCLSPYTLGLSKNLVLLRRRHKFKPAIYVELAYGLVRKIWMLLIRK